MSNLSERVALIRFYFLELSRDLTHLCFASLLASLLGPKANHLLPTPALNDQPLSAIKSDVMASRLARRYPNLISADAMTRQCIL